MPTYFSPNRQQPSPSSGAPEGPRPRILIVDDMESTREMLGFFLQRKGFDVLYAGDGKTALAVVEAQKPAVVVLDILMPAPDGYQVCAQIKSRPELGGVKIVMCSALTTAGDKRRAEQAGANAFLEKPILMDQLLEAVRTLLP